jgi:hypothetical protein
MKFLIEIYGNNTCQICEQSCQIISITQVFSTIFVCNNVNNLVSSFYYGLIGF